MVNTVIASENINKTAFFIQFSFIALILFNIFNIILLFIYYLFILYYLILLFILFRQEMKCRNCLKNTSRLLLL